MELIISLLTDILELLDTGFKVFEPYQGSVNMDEKHYSAMQGIIHFIGWTIIIAILVWVFKYMKKHTQQDERMKKYYDKKD
ncbi:hypothetical protein GWK41_01495 [Persephonella atlantica]|uniref:CcmD family protein n=1 Tax=Persephonella atlantica TaxID=2699429 RepID=A0ABS1GG29_9AQUI|nr:hypothetical protein [Persephonella atlantica]MBK3331737.1 hypothetical protein [Persephonella atlantica]